MSALAIDWFRANSDSASNNQEAPAIASSNSPRVVLDTNVALALFAYADPSCSALAEALAARRLQAVANAATLAEWRNVLWREALPFDRATRQRAERAFDARLLVDDACALRSAAVLPRCRDPDDQCFLELARDAGCATLYSRDRELLKLSRRCLRVAGFDVRLPEDHFS